MGAKRPPAGPGILFVTSEAVPFAKVGGLADVAGTLPLALRRLGADARLLMPLYGFVRKRFGDRLRSLGSLEVAMGWRRQYCGLFVLEEKGMPCYFLENEYYFGHDRVYIEYGFDIERFSFFQRAAATVLDRLEGFRPDVVHGHDWQCGMLPLLLRRDHADREPAPKSVLTIHNLKYQGVHGRDAVADFMGLDPSEMAEDGILHNGDPNFLKTGIVYAHAITTVSPTYAREIMTPYYGEGLDCLLRTHRDKLRGILNGIDTDAYDPSKDDCLPARYSLRNWRKGKAACRQDVMEEMGLAPNPDGPLAVMISRLVDQKGLDLLIRVLDDLMATGLSLAILGTGDPYYERLLSDAAARYPGRLSIRIAYHDPLARRLYAGSDLFLMPSLFEPCGLSQMIAMRYGSLPVVRETGGLKDTVTPFNRFTCEGNGFSFMNINAHEFLYTVQAACRLHRDDPDAFRALVRSAMASDFSWTVSARSYLDLYRTLIGTDAST